MKKVKVVLWFILIGFVSLVFFQNQEFLLSKQTIALDLYLTEAFQSPELPNAVWFAAALFIGLLLAYFVSLVERFRSNKTIKELKSKLNSHADMVSRLRTELESTKISPPMEPEPSYDSESGEAVSSDTDTPPQLPNA
ncbi:MAG: LapA family protein [Deltaproteobacteria bacterium]|nr:LapA family protein [Deltaproteobacteria bacterium]